MLTSKIEQAFVDAICADPDNPTLRLIFVDWLEEQGRGEDAAKIRKGLHQIRLPQGQAGEQLTIINNLSWPVRLYGLKEKIIQPWSVASILFFEEWFIDGVIQKTEPGSSPEGTLIVGIDYMAHYTAVGHI